MQKQATKTETGRSFQSDPLDWIQDRPHTK
jgi:hypothetical protein